MPGCLQQHCDIFGVSEHEPGVYHYSGHWTEWKQWRGKYALWITIIHFVSQRWESLLRNKYCRSMQMDVFFLLNFEKMYTIHFYWNKFNPFKYIAKNQQIKLKKKNMNSWLHFTHCSADAFLFVFKHIDNISECIRSRVETQQRQHQWVIRHKPPSRMCV